MRFCPTCQGVYEDPRWECPNDRSPLLSELAAVPPDPADAVGLVLAKRYRVDAVLGVGGVGVVFRASHLFLQRDVAIKVLRPELVSIPAQRRRFLLEAKAASEMRHPNVVDVLDFGVTDDGVFYLVMEMLAGRSLAERLGTPPPLDPCEAARIAAGVLAGVDAVHRRGVIHRDLKAENFIIEDGPDQRVKLLDFGLAQVFAPGRGPGRERLTGAGLVMGSPFTMAPEQARGLPLDARADIYAVGCILFEMLAGRPPFEGDDGMQVMACHMNVPPPRLADLAPGVPEAIERVVMRCLEKRADDRPCSVAEVAEAFGAAIESPGPATRPIAAPLPAPRPAGPRLRAWLGIASLLALAVFAAGWFASAYFLDASPAIVATEQQPAPVEPPGTRSGTGSAAAPGPAVAPATSPAAVPPAAAAPAASPLPSRPATDAAAGAGSPRAPARRPVRKGAPAVPDGWIDPFAPGEGR
ncbi:MAG: serine/threonine protein kinase [Deltaproteobacteria bacterium]|nr:serine/threonine protein kinase [Deltaproteobacteria bacterium]